MMEAVRKMLKPQIFFKCQGRKMNQKHLFMFHRALYTDTPLYIQGGEDPSPSNDKFKEHNYKVLCSLKVGDLIKFKRPINYFHWAVFVGSYDNRENAVIHWWGPESSILPKLDASLMCNTFWEVAKGDKAEHGNEDDKENSSIDGSRVARRAIAKYSLVTKERIINERYNIVFNNCEDFAKWCRYGHDKTGKEEEQRHGVREEEQFPGSRKEKSSKHTATNTDIFGKFVESWEQRYRHLLEKYNQLQEKCEHLEEKLGQMIDKYKQNSAHIKLIYLIGGSALFYLLFVK